MFWIHDGVVFPIHLFPRPLDVQFTGTVTALAADRVAFEDRLAEAIYRVLHVIGAVAMADQAADADRPVEMVFAAKRWRQVPRAFLRIPTDRRLEEIAALALSEIRPATGAGA